MTDLLFPALAHKRLRAWPKHADGGVVPYRTLQVLLTQEFATDVHFAAYSRPALERRLCLDVLRDPAALAQLGGSVPMVLALFDVDCPQVHRGAAGDADAWWLAELEKIQRLLVTHPQGFVYRTRGGYRLVYRLAEPFVLQREADAEAWAIEYLTWAAYLERVFSIAVDPACREWVRLFRAPHATRDEGGQPEQRETIGDPTSVGTWQCAPSEADRATARKALAKKPPRPRRPRTPQPAGPPPPDGVLKILFAQRGWLGSEVNDHTFAAVCPNEASHTTGARLDGSTVIFPPGTGEIFGHLHCRHAHCTALTLRDVLRAFPAEQVDAAKATVRSRTGAAAPSPAAEQRATREGERTSVLVPGEHTTEDGVAEVGTDAFAVQVLKALPEDTLYRMDFVVGRIAGPPGARRFVELDDTGMRMVIDRHARLHRRARDRQGELTESYVSCGRDLAGLVRSAAGVAETVPSLRQIVNYPVYLPGFELAAPGWNPAAGVYYDEPPDLVGLTPNPEGALEVLNDLLVDWPFADQASRENAFGLMLTAILRPTILGPIPFHLVSASLERVGKGKLIDTALGYAIRGYAVDPTQIGDSEAEREKRITGLMLQGCQAVHFDNIATDHVLDSPALASLGTAWPNWSGRILGVSKVPQLPNAAVWVLSGNNVSASGELAKRTVLISLQPKDDKPQLRTDFLHPDCVAYAKQRRRAVLEALLGIVEGWKGAGRPLCSVPMGGYERWAEAVGSPLRHAGAAQWMANYTRWVTSGDDMQVDAEVLVTEWARDFGNGAVTAAQLMSIVERTGAFRSVQSHPTQEGRLVVFGRKVLKALVNRPVKTWIVRRLTSGSSATYRLEPLQSPVAPPGPAPGGKQVSWVI